MNLDFGILSKNMNLVILVLYAYVLMNHVKDNDYTTMTALTVATLMAICYLKKKKSRLVEGAESGVNQCDFHGHCGDDYSNEGFTADMANSTDSTEDTAADVADVADVATSAKDSDKLSAGPVRHLPSVMGPYDGLCLQTGNKESWMKTPDNVQLVPNDALYSYLGSQGPLKPVFSDNSALHGPPIEGDASSDPKKMFILANNRTSPNCCPGTFSTSTGCVCTTDKQRDFIASRGHNKGDKVSFEDF